MNLVTRPLFQQGNTTGNHGHASITRPELRPEDLPKT